MRHEAIGTETASNAVKVNAKMEDDGPGLSSVGNWPAGAAWGMWCAAAELCTPTLR